MIKSNNIALVIVLLAIVGCGDFNEGKITGALLRDDAMPAEATIEVIRTGAWNKTRVKVQVYYVAAAADPHPPSEEDYAQIVGGIGQMMEKVQQFFASELARHGYEDKTFEMFRNLDGSLAVGRLTLPNSQERYWKRDGWDQFQKDLRQVPNRIKHPNSVGIYFVDMSRSISYLPGGYASGGVTGGHAVVFRQFGWHFDILCHELGHAFGLQHDWRNDAYMMSYGPDPDKLSAGAAGWLARHSAFNKNATPGGHDIRARHNVNDVVNADFTELTFTVPLRIYQYSVEDKDPTLSYDYAVLLNTTKNRRDVIAYTDNITMEIRIEQLWDGDILRPQREIVYDVDFDGTLPEDCEEIQIQFMGKNRYVAVTEWLRIP